jgi:RHS repeat-associated protein
MYTCVLQKRCAMAAHPAPRPPVFVRFGQRFHSLLTHPALWQRVRQGAISLLLLLTLLCGPNGLLTNVSVSFAQTQVQASSSGKPNRFDPTQDATSVTHPLSTGKSDPNWKAGKPQPLTHPKLPLMAPGTLVLHAGQAATFLGSDGRLEVDVPASALSATDQTQAGGSLSLLVSQIAPASGSSAGGSGHITLGTYLVQLVDAHGKRVHHGLHAPLTLTWHAKAGESLAGLTQPFVVFNSALPAGVTLAPAADASTPTLGAVARQPATLDATQQTLSVTTTPAVSSLSLSYNTDSPVAAFGKPDLFNVGLNTGSLDLGYPLDLPAGPNGQVPPLTLGYSSEGVSEQHSVQGAAGWVGEGWSLSPGAISWAEHNVLAGVSGGPKWQNSWQLSDPYGTGSELIPPTITTSLYYDDTGNGLAPEPIFWYTATESHAKIVSFTGPVSLSGNGVNVPCFRVFLPNGIMEEFGCTSDSIQYYYQLSGGNSGLAYVSSWFLDLITDRYGNQIHFTYQADMATDSGGHAYPRDVVLSTVEWDSPTCRDAQNRCTGAAWAPLLRVNFAASHTPTRLTNTPSGCNTGSNLRCDDPLDLSGSSGLAAPQVQSTWVLNDLQVQVQASGAWQTLKDYQFSYEQSGPGRITDPSTGQAESTAGMLDLTQIRVVGDDGTTALPTSTYSYTSVTEHYEDDAYRAPSGNCGPSWNNSACLLWSQSYDGNSRYLTTADNGLGLHQVFSWAEARNNTHGVNGGGTNALNPLYCSLVLNYPSSYPCNQADDQNWSHIVLTQEKDTIIRLSQNGQGGQQTSTPVDSITSYSYQLTTYSANPCSDCLQGMYWGNQNDADYLDYYNGKFMGFAQTTVIHSDGAKDVHQYHSTLGWGIYDTSQVTCYSSNPCHNDSWWDYHNTLHGHEDYVLSYDTNGTTLLRKVDPSWAWTCPPSGVPGSGSTSYGNFNGNLVSELDHNNPVAACAIQMSQESDTTYDGSNASGVPLKTTVYQYDSYGRVTQATTTSNDGGATGSPTTSVQLTTYLWNDAVTATSTSATGTYLIDFVAFSGVEDANGVPKVCTYTSYDGLPYETGAASNFTGAGAVTTTDRYATSCGPSSQGSGGFSSIQGQNQWRYQYSTDGEVSFHDMTYTTNWGGSWQGSESGCEVAAGWMLPGGASGCDAIRTWVAQGSGTVTLTANGPITVNADCGGGSNGVLIRVLKNGAQVWPASGWQSIPHSGSFTFPPLTISVAAGDQLELVDAHNGSSNWCDNTGWDPIVTFLAPTTIHPTVTTVGYTASAGFGATEGQNQWRYQYSTDGEQSFRDMGYTANWGGSWQGTEATCEVAGWWLLPGGASGCDAVRTWVAPGSGTVTLTANGPITVSGGSGCGGNTSGVLIRVLKNGAQIWPASGWQSIPNSGSFTFPTLTIPVAAGDNLELVDAHAGSVNYCDNTDWDPIVSLARASGGEMPVESTFTYDAFGNPLTSTDPDANAGITGHTGCTVGGTAYTTCTAYDSTFEALPTSSANTLNQTSSLGYTQTASGGFGLWPTSATDVNGQTTTATYDALGRMTSQTLPGETTGLTTASRTYTDFCGATGAQSPCVEIDSTQRLNSTTTVTSRSFYDGWGHLVETRSPAPNGQDVVQYYYYDPSGRQVFASVQYFVAAYTGVPGAAAYSLPDSTQAGTSLSYTSLLSSSVTDALSHTSTSSSAVVCNQQTPSGSTDSACYVQSSAIDPLGHKQSSLMDALGREVYDQRYTGNSTATYAIYSTTQYSYDYLGNLVQILHPGGTITSTFQYDMLGRQTGMTDPDQGTESYSYDPNGNIVQTVDARGSTGTIYAGYDGLNRQLWRNTTNSASGAYVTFSYDSTANGNHGVGSLTGETFTNGSLTGSYSTVYDQRGRPVSTTVTVGSTTYPSQVTYDDAGDVLTKTYPDGEVVTNSYTQQAWLAGVSTLQGSTTTTLLSNVVYSDTAGAGGLMTGASLGGGTYTYAATYDLLLRLIDSKVTRTSNNATLFEQAVTYDAAGNVSHLTTTLPQGTDQQQFCYDEQNRMTWAGAVGTPPCTGTAITPGSLTAAQYSQSYSFDTLDRLTSASPSTYNYGDSHHLHAVTSIGSSYTASYDAAGNMTCRAPTSVTTCVGGTPTGAQSAYDNEGRLAHWQNTPSSPTTTINYLYDGAGNRVAQQVTGTTTSTTVYVGSIEEVTASGATTTTTTYYYANEQRIALAVNGVFSYLCTDILGSVSVALDGSGAAQASQLFGPYGTVRYSSGTMPGSFGFTSQQANSASGLNYDNARYYDPVAGAFTSADIMLPGGGYDSAGLNRYGYVAGNPETFTDPSGHCPIPECIVIPFLMGFVDASILAIGACIMFCLMAWSFYRSYQDLRNLFSNSDSFTGSARAIYPGEGGEGQLRERVRLKVRDIKDPLQDQPTGSIAQGPTPSQPPIEGGTAPNVPIPPPLAQNLPDRQNMGDKTDCVLQEVDDNGSPVGEGLKLQSGGSSGFGFYAKDEHSRGFVGVPGFFNSHCEAHAIALMNILQWSSAILWINNPPCDENQYGEFSCTSLMSQRLKSGYNLRMWVRAPTLYGLPNWTPSGPPGGYVGAP